MHGITSHIFYERHLFLLALEQKFIRHINEKYSRNKH